MIVATRQQEHWDDDVSQVVPTVQQGVLPLEDRPQEHPVGREYQSASESECYPQGEDHANMKGEFEPGIGITEGVETECSGLFELFSEVSPGQYRVGAEEIVTVPVLTRIEHEADKTQERAHAGDTENAPRMCTPTVYKCDGFHRNPQINPPEILENHLRPARRRITLRPLRELVHIHPDLHGL